MIEPQTHLVRGRTFVALVAGSIAALCAAMLIASGPASADSTTVIKVGDGEYTLSFTHPTGTLSVGGGSTSARCAAYSFKGSSTYGTPRCTTRKITCPVTATSCSMTANFQESAVKGPVAFAGGLSITGSASGFSTQQPYNCPGATNCGWKFSLASVSPGSIVQAQIINFTDSRGTTVSVQTNLAVH